MARVVNNKIVEMEVYRRTEDFLGFAQMTAFKSGRVELSNNYGNTAAFYAKEAVEAFGLTKTPELIRVSFGEATLYVFPYIETREQFRVPEIKKGVVTYSEEKACDLLKEIGIEASIL